MSQSIRTRKQLGQLATQNMAMNVPVYQRVKNDLSERILSGNLPSGTMLPSRKTLAEQYGVALVTLEHAIADLLSDGLLRADKGRGTFVTDGALSNQPIAPSGVRSGSNRPTTIGILTYLFPDQMDPGNNAYDLFKMTILKSLERGLSGGGRHTEFHALENLTQERTLNATLSSMAERGFDGLALILDDQIEVVEAVMSVVDTATTPVVWISSGDLPYPIPHVYWNNSDASYEAASHLIRRGYDRSLYFIRHFSDVWVDERIEGVRKAIKAAGLSENILKILPKHDGLEPLDLYHRDAGYLATKEMARQGLLRGAGIIAANDNVGIGALKASDEEGYVAGIDFGLIGFDDLPESRLLGLSTIAPPLEALGQEAATLLIRGINGEKMPINVRVGSQLVPRASTRAAMERSSAVDPSVESRHSVALAK